MIPHLQVSLVVSVTRPTVAEARQEGAAATSAVLAAVGEVNNVAKENITTENISLQPNYVWEPQTS
jgi:uncharacterized protein YggE